MDALLSMQHIQKFFGKVQALSDGSFDLKEGEVHALLGANGAGKSTMMKVLSGVYEHDGGELHFQGTMLRFKSPKEAKEAGIYCVYQEVDTAIVPELSVAENIMLDTFAADKYVFVQKKKLHEKARSLLKELQAENIAVSRPASSLTLAEKQLILLARALVLSAKVIIFDEPTAPLSAREADRLFQVIRKLKSQGVGCIFISHRLPEIFKISDRITVMREGKTVKTVLTRETTQSLIVETMLGAAFSEELEKHEKEIGPCLLEVEKLSDGHLLKEVSFQVAEGEIVGVVGLVGAGKTELAKALFGVAPARTGNIKMHGKAVKIRQPREAIASGIVLVPEERRKEGLFVYESVSVNASFPNLSKFSRNLFINKAAENSFATKMIDRLQIKTDSPNTPLVHLSGGNQQKVAIGKWMSRDSAVYLFDEPTKGVDIGAKVDIFHLIREFAGQGKG
ncbi:MAG TPA: sugar ABC transporter ATP-binding protein, partial [Bacillaceae bacterium]